MQNENILDSYDNSGFNKYKINKSKHRHCDDFINYIMSLQTSSIIRDIKSEFLRIKGSYNITVRMGKSATVEFAIILLLLKYSRDRQDKKNKINHDIILKLSDAIGCAFNQMPVTEWSDYVEDIILQDNTLITINEFSSLYKYLKENCFKEINLLEFSIHNSWVMRRLECFHKLKEQFGDENSYKERLQYYKSQGLNLG